MFRVRPEERSQAWAAFAFLTALVASHTVLETARDALFLARLPAGHLPFVYLAIAAVSLAVARWEGRLFGAVSHQASLLGWTVAAGVGTLICFLFVPGTATSSLRDSAGLYVLYVFSGVVVALTSGHLWSVLGESLSITQAKRLFPFVGAGSSVGALAGSAAATLLARRVRADQLLVASAAGFFVSAGAAAVLSSATGEARRERVRTPSIDLAREAALVAREPYLQRLAAFTLVSAGVLTIVDFLFKSTVAANVRPGDLAVFFGTVALALNVLSLFTQLAVVPRVLKHAGPVLALAVLPLGLAVGGVGLLLGFGLGAALVVKGADGGLRYSLHRTATELLYVPLPDRVRSRVRATLDVFGQRAGQAVASIFILVIVAAKVPVPVVAACFIAVAAAWVGCALALRQPYVSVLGASLRRGAALRAPVFPELDVASLETLVASLDSNDDAEVLAGIDVLEREGKERLVPALLLRHPSDTVVERTLAVLVRSRRTSAVGSIDAVLDHTSIPVRRAAIAARSILEHDAKLLYQRLSLEEAPEVRATIVVHLIASGELVGKEAADRLDELVAHGDAATKSALAGAIGMRDHHAFDHVLGALAVAAEPEVRVAAVEAMAQHRAPSYLPILVRALGSERTRAAAKSALVAFGDAGFAAARDALRDRSLSRDVRWALPQTLAAFDHEPAADVLLAELVREPSGVVRYRIIRALEALVASHPRLRLRRAALSRVVEETLSKAFRRIDQRLLLEAGAAAARERATPGYELLRDALSDKETGLRDRLLRLLGLIHPQVDFASVRRGLRASSAKTRASSVELVASVVDTRIRGAVVALLEDLPPEERLEGAGAFYHPEPAEYDELLAQMLREEGEALREIVAFHLDELRIAKEAAC